MCSPSGCYLHWSHSPPPSATKERVECRLDALIKYPGLPVTLGDLWLQKTIDKCAVFAARIRNKTTITLSRKPASLNATFLSVDSIPSTPYETAQPMPHLSSFAVVKMKRIIIYIGQIRDTSSPYLMMSQHWVKNASS